MKSIEQPKVYLIAKTQLVREGLEDYLNDIGNPDWQPDAEVSDGENLVEAAGRMCYGNTSGRRLRPGFLRRIPRHPAANPDFRYHSNSLQDPRGPTGFLRSGRLWVVLCFSWMLLFLFPVCPVKADGLLRDCQGSE